VYSLLWKQIELSKFVIAGAQYGGPIGKKKFGNWYDKLLPE
jgi:hypothetical protein